MSSKTANPVMRSAAWRISLWATLAFAIGIMLVFVMLHRFVANDIQRRSDAWLTGEVAVLGDVAGRTPKGPPLRSGSGRSGGTCEQRGAKQTPLQQQ
jgi:hypothetical protein